MNIFDAIDNVVLVKIKRLHENAVIPSYAKPGDAGIDLTAVTQDFERLKNGSAIITYGTGLAFEIPKGYVGLIYPRSSISKTAISLTNSVGVIDSGYRGEVIFKFRLDANSRPTDGSIYKIGDRVGQIVVMPYPKVALLEVEELSTTERGTGGFGSSGS